MIYIYKCVECDHLQEELRRMDERNDPGMCERCKGEACKVEVTQIARAQWKCSCPTSSGGR